ncbi:MAG: undecaprenyl-diphosphate phosphatase [Bacteroidales bacterium]
MSWIEALILGLVQGLTEFLPVSSSGHLELGKVFLDIEAKENLTFSILVHAATVLSIIVVFFKDLRFMISEVIKFQWNESTVYSVKIAVSMIPVVIVGIFLKSEIESIYTGKIVFVGIMLLITASLLLLTYFAKSRNKDVTFRDAFIIGIAQAVAVLPGISRSGATIATGLFLGVRKDLVTRFSFLMVLVPIIGATLLDILQSGSPEEITIGFIPLLIGFVAAFISGLFACRVMLNVVRKGKLIYFAIYCILAASIAISLG